MSKINSFNYDLVYKTSTTPFFPICFCGRNYSVSYQKLAKVKGQPKPVVAIISNDVVNWYFHKSLSVFAREILDRFFYNDDIIKRIRIQEKELSKKLLSLMQNPISKYFNGGTLNDVGKKALVELFKAYTEYAYYVDVPGFLFQVYYVDKYRVFINSRLKNKLTESDFNNLLCLPSLTNYEKFNLEIIKLIRGGITDRKIKALEKKYYWIVHDYLGEVVDFDYLKKYVFNFKKKIKQELVHINEANIRIKNINKTLKQLPPGVREQAQRLHELMWYYNDRKKEVLNKVNIYIRQIIITKFPSWSFKKLHKLYQYSPDEIINILSLTKEVAPEKRAAYYVYEIINGNFKPGKVALGKLLAGEAGNIISGSVAMSGRVTGKVNIVLNISHISKFKSGDILVAPFTNVNYLPIMRKAKAILTETGGLTSHAAIVARELKKPCLVGVKNLIASVRDGQSIKIDAFKGRVVLK